MVADTTRNPSGRRQAAAAGAGADGTAPLLKLLAACVHPSLPERFGWQVATSIKELGQQAEREPPAVVHYDAWGARVDTGRCRLAIHLEALGVQLVVCRRAKTCCQHPYG